MLDVCTDLSLSLSLSLSLTLSLMLGAMNHFVADACGKGPLSKNCYVLTKSGRLCLFDDEEAGQIHRGQGTLLNRQVVNIDPYDN